MCCYWATKLPLQHLLPIQSWAELQWARGCRYQGLPLQPSSVGTTVCSNRGSNTTLSFVDLLGHNPASPPLYCKKEPRTAAPPVQTEKTEPLCSPCPFSVSTEVHDLPLLPPCNPKSFKNTPTFLLPPPSAFHLERIQKMSSERTSQI